MEYLNPNNTLPNFAENFHNKFEVPVLSLDNSYYVNCDKSSSNYNKREDKYEEETYDDLEEKVEEAEMGNHSQLCKCGSNSEICEDFINSFSLQDILSNFEIPISSSTDEDDEMLSTKKQNEDDEELNLIDFLNNTKFINEFVNRNSIKIDQVCIKKDTVDLIAKSNRKKKNLTEDNQQISRDNQNNACDNQIPSSGSGNEADNHCGMDPKVIMTAIIDGARGQHFSNEEESSSDFSVHSEEDSRSNMCANFNTTPSNIPLPSFDTFKSKNVQNVQSQPTNIETNMCETMKTTISKYMEMFNKNEITIDESLSREEDKILDSTDESVMGIDISQQINEFDRYTEEPSLLEQMLANGRGRTQCEPIVYDETKNIVCSKTECQKSLNLEESNHITSNSTISNTYEQTNLQGNLVDIGRENSTLNNNVTQNIQCKRTMNQYEEVIDSGNFWIDNQKNNKAKYETKSLATGQTLSNIASATLDITKDIFRVPVNFSAKSSKIVEELESDEGNVKKSVKILTKTHLLNSMQFDKNQRNFINSPHFLLLLTKPMKFPTSDGQCCNKKLSNDTKNKLVSLQNNIRTQIRNAQLLRSKNLIHGKECNMIESSALQKTKTNETFDFQKSFERSLAEKTQYESDMHVKYLFNEKNKIIHPVQDTQNNTRATDSDDNVKNHVSCDAPSNIRDNQTINKDPSKLMNKTENFRFDQEFKILTLRTENADCINKKVKVQKGPLDTQHKNEIPKPVVLKIKQKIKSSDEKYQCLYLRKKNEVENDPTLRRSERIRVKKEKKRQKHCLLSNVKKTKAVVQKRSLPMSLVDQNLHLKKDYSIESNIESKGGDLDDKYDMITYKSCFITEEIINGQKIQKLDYVSIITTKESSLVKNMNIVQTEKNGMRMQNIGRNHQDLDTDQVSREIDNSKSTIINNDKINENSDNRKPSSLKSKYPNLEALISSTSNEVKPIIRKRKRIKFDKSKYEKIKKINKEKENNMEQNKILLLNLNKNSNNKVMQNLLLIRDQNNKTHLLFTKPIDNDTIKIVPERNYMIEKETKQIKLNENNPNYINKKIEEIQIELCQQNELHYKNKDNSAEKTVISDPLLTAPCLMDGTVSSMDVERVVDFSDKSKERNEITINLQYCPTNSPENKADSPSFTFVNNENSTEESYVTPIHGINEKRFNTRNIMTTSNITTQTCNSSSEIFNTYGFYSMEENNNILYNQTVVNGNTRVSKSFKPGNFFVDATTSHQSNESPKRFYYDQNSTLSIDEVSCISPTSNTPFTEKRQNNINQEFSSPKDRGIINENELSLETSSRGNDFESNFNQTFNQNFITSEMPPRWEMKTANITTGESMIQNSLENATSSNDNESYGTAITLNTISQNLPQFNDNSKRIHTNTFQPTNIKYPNTSKLFEPLGIDLSNQTFLPDNVNVLGIATGVTESHQTVLDGSLFLETNTSVESNSNNFSTSFQSSANVNENNFRNIFESVETCWEDSSSKLGWSDGMNHMASTSSDNYDEHLQLSEEIMKKSLQEDEKIFEKEKLHVCTYEDCNSVFQTLAEWEEHARMHAVQRPFGCRYCDKAFKTSGDLSKHSATHNGDRPYKCNYTSCGRHFRTHTQRQIHERCHQDLKPYSCQVCGRTFISNTHKNNHLRIHYGLKPYVCHVEGCKRKFVDLSSLKKHTKIHTQQTFHCNLCNKTYKHQQSIITHYQEVHGVVVQDVSECTK